MPRQPSTLSPVDTQQIGESWSPYWDPNRTPTYVPDHDPSAHPPPHTVSTPTHMTDHDRRFYEQSPANDYGSPQLYINSRLNTSHSRNTPISPTYPHHSHSFQIVSSAPTYYPPEMNATHSPSNILSFPSHSQSYSDILRHIGHTVATGSAKRLSSLEGASSSFNSFSGRPVEVHNLLGPIHASASRLLDDQDRPGIFFVFQDLSIRTEGTPLP